MPAGRRRRGSRRARPGARPDDGDVAIAPTLPEGRDGRRPHALVLVVVGRDRRAAVAWRCGARTRPSVSTSRVAGAGGSAPRAGRPRGRRPTCSDAAADHCSSVRWATMPPKPPSTTRPTRRPIVSKRGRRGRAPRRRARGGIVRPLDSSADRTTSACSSKTSASACRGRDGGELVVAGERAASARGWCGPRRCARRRRRGRRRGAWSRPGGRPAGPRRARSGCPCGAPFPCDRRPAATGSGSDSICGG